MKTIHNIIHYFRYGKTQPSVFNDLPSKEQVKIIRGAMRKAKKLQDRVLEDASQKQAVPLSI